MKLSKYYIPTLREVPADAEIPSHQLLLRSGMVRKLVSGVYSYLPLGKRVLDKIERIVREEMDESGSLEVLMSAIQPSEVWKETGRWENFGPEMFRLYDRHEREFCLGPTHEEIFTDVIRNEVKSYKQLPLNLYQIQTKYRDEKRPRFGVIRSREFIMKDAYSFDLNPEGMAASYQEMWDAYVRIFDRMRIEYKVVAGDSGAMGGNNSHEFCALADTGESTILYSDDCDFAATDEKAECVYPLPKQDAAEAELEKVHTPNVGTIADLEAFFGCSSDRFAKTLLFETQDEVFAVMIPGNRELNEVKLYAHLGIAEHDIAMASEETVEAVTNARVGFAGPIGLDKKVRILVDDRIRQMKNFVVGACETDYHYKNANYGRDFEGELVKDLLLAKEGDLCPNCPYSLLKSDRGIEVGNIFQLGTKYSESLHATYLDENGKEQLMWMGSYGIGVSRSMAAIIEQNHDEKGIIWPLVVAPYQVLVTVVNSKKEEQAALGEEIYARLRNAGLEVLLDDRKERAGVKFNDADLIGIPIRINVGRDAGENKVEFSLRKEGDKKELSTEALLDEIKTVFESEGLRAPY